MILMNVSTIPCNYALSQTFRGPFLESGVRTADCKHHAQEHPTTACIMVYAVWSVYATFNKWAPDINLICLTQQTYATTPQERISHHRNCQGGRYTYHCTMNQQSLQGFYLLSEVCCLKDSVDVHEAAKMTLSQDVACSSSRSSTNQLILPYLKPSTILTF